MDASVKMSSAKEILAAAIGCAKEDEKGLIARSWPEAEDQFLCAEAICCIHPGIEPLQFLRILLSRQAWPVYMRRFADRLVLEPGLRNRVLDIGCGGSIPGCLEDVAKMAGQLDGVDPSEAVMHHPSMTERYCMAFDAAPIESKVYDLAYAFNVLEHISAPRPFFEKLRSVLKPGGVFWGLTPNSRHIFAKLSRALELTGIKWLMARRIKSINNYSAYYRLNSESQVTRAIKGLGFESAEFHFIDALGWELGYLPPGTRWIGRSFDKFIASANPSRKLILMYRLVAGA
jgi:SAM-dependent methyltransferase